MTARSHSPAPTAAHADRRPQPSDAGHATTETIRDITEDSVTLTEEAVHCALGSSSTEEILQVAVQLRKLTDELIAGVVVRGRQRGEPLEPMAELLELSTDRLRRKYRPEEAGPILAARTRPRPPATRRQSSEKGGVRLPPQRLSAALSRLHHSSGLTQATLARRMDIHPSYLSRLLSGERSAQWPHVKGIAEAASTDPEDFRPLWEVTAQIKPSPDTSATAYLRTYLRSLRYAVGSPAEETIISATGNTVTAAALQQALHGPGVPAWSVIEAVTSALYSLPSPAAPLWRATQKNAEASPAPTEAFG